MKRAKGMFWRLFDPVLSRVAARLAHLEDNQPQWHDAARWRSIADFGAETRFLEGASVINHGAREALAIGDFTHVAGELAIVAPEGGLRLGRYCFVGPGSRLWAQTSIVIGDHVLIAHLVDIHDTNAHSTNATLRRRDPVNLFEHHVPIDWRNVDSTPVVIEDDVWLGFKSSVLKGVTIGRGSIVAAGAMVTKDVPAYTLVAGNPARVVRELERDSG